MGSKVGTRAPVHSTAVGKTLLAFQPEEEIERIIARGLPASAPNTLVDAKILWRELAFVRARNYAVDEGTRDRRINPAAKSEGPAGALQSGA